MNPAEREKRVTRRSFALANRVRAGQFNDRQLQYLSAVLDHYYRAIEEMTDEQA